MFHVCLTIGLGGLFPLSKEKWAVELMTLPTPNKPAYYGLRVCVCVCEWHSAYNKCLVCVHRIYNLWVCVTVHKTYVLCVCVYFNRKNVSGALQSLSRHIRGRLSPSSALRWTRTFCCSLRGWKHWSPRQYSETRTNIYTSRTAHRAAYKQIWFFFCYLFLFQEQDYSWKCISNNSVDPGNYPATLVGSGRIRQCLNSINVPFYAIENIFSDPTEICCSAGLCPLLNPFYCCTSPSIDLLFPSKISC